MMNTYEIIMLLLLLSVVVVVVDVVVDVLRCCGCRQVVDVVKSLKLYVDVD